MVPRSTFGVTLNLARTLAGHFEIDLLDRPQEVTQVRFDRDALLSTVKVSELLEEPSSFSEGTGRSPKANITVSELLSMRDFRREPERHGRQVGLCWTFRALAIRTRQRSRSWEEIKRMRTILCDRESTGRPFDGPRGGDCSRASRERETVCVRGGCELHRSSCLELAICEIHLVCFLGRRVAAVSEADRLQLMARSWVLLTTIPELAARVHRRCGGGHVHVQGTDECEIPPSPSLSGDHECSPTEGLESH